MSCLPRRVWLKGVLRTNVSLGSISRSLTSCWFEQVQEHNFFFSFFFCAGVCFFFFLLNLFVLISLGHPLAAAGACRVGNSTLAVLHMSTYCSSSPWLLGSPGTGSSGCIISPQIRLQSLCTSC